MKENNRLLILLTLGFALATVVTLLMVFRPEYFGLKSRTQKARETPTSYNECVQFGYEVQESDPPKCITPDGLSFTGRSSAMNPVTVEGELKYSGVLRGDGASASVQNSSNYTVRNREEWENLLGILAQKDNKSIPSIDFEKEMIFGVLVASRPNGGYRVSIDKIEIKKDNFGNQFIEITGKVIKPGRNCITNQVITNPYDFIKTERRELNTIFKISEETEECKAL